MLRKIVAKNVRAIRQAKGISQQELSKRTKLTVRYLSRMENYPQNVTLETVEVIARGLECSVTELIEDRSSNLKSPKAKQMLRDAIVMLKTAQTLME